jgi:very-short-patch-repair endonuclease
MHTEKKDSSMEQVESPFAGDDQFTREKAIRLFTYLRELTELRSEVKRNCEEYDQVVWWAEIPRENECYCAFWDLGREGAYEDWIRVERPRRKRPPTPPPSLAPWLNEREIANSSIEAPSLRESIVEVLKESSQDSNGAETVVRRLEEFPAITRQWELYVENHWWPWALEDRRLQTIQAIYNDLFAAYQTQERLGEAFETVVGVGLLTWKPPHGPAIRRHVVAGQVTIEFDPKTGSISVSPAAEGIRLTLEQEMLEPQDRPLPEIQNQLQQRLTGIGDEVWTGPELTSILREYFQQLSPSDTLEITIEPVDGKAEHREPLMSLSPALLVRKRTERSMVRIFQEIAQQLQEGASIPIGVEKLVAIRDDRTNAESGSEGRTSVARELYFPLPANEAQREIAKLLDSRQGVLVQGPPGTGKSHTIANLICHLLATGQKLLVTSHTARALRVLKGYFPSEISPLCVSLLGDDAIALRELEESVQGILSKLNAWNPNATETKVCELESSLDTARRELAGAYGVLRKIRQSETGEVGLGFQDYRGTPQTLAQRLNDEARESAWLNLDVPFNCEPPLNNQEMHELLILIRDFRREDDEAVWKSIPEVASVTDPTSLDKSFMHERGLATKVAGANPSHQEMIQSLARANRESRVGLDLALRDFSLALNSLAEGNDQWTDVIAREVLLGKHLAWQELHDLTIRTLGEIAEDLGRVAQMKTSGLEGRDRAVLRADAAELKSHLVAGKSTGFIARNSPFVSKHVKSSLYLTTEVRVNGKLCDSIAVIEDLLSYLRVADSLEYLKQCWSVCTAEPSTALELTVVEYKRRIGQLHKALGLKEKIEAAKSSWAQITQTLQIDWQDKQALVSLISAVDLAHSEAELSQVRDSIAGHGQALKSFQRDPNAHPVIHDLIGAIEVRDSDCYARAHQQLTQLLELRASHQRRRTLESKLSNPILSKQLWDTAHDAKWDNRVARFTGAWNWCRANDWLKTFTDPARQSAILQQIDLSQKRIRQDLASLASFKAWEYVLSRLNHEQREHLIAWRLAIKKIGKGTGKYATQYRKEARYHLDHCRGAIPAWVMPIYRVAESTRPAPNLFDVAIIDEASQSGPEALFLQYIAKKIVVVGDDQQISPDAVGLDRESVDTLRQRYIKDIPMYDALGVDNSFFDQAQIRFSGRVRLREHFRCMPEIIQFSNGLCYEAEPLIPLRQYGAGRLEPVLTRYIPDGYVKGTGDRIVNPSEAEAIANQIEKCIGDPAYDGKRFGVICLQGNAQWNLIRNLLLERVGAQKLQQRGLVGGNAYAFQGDERDVIFLSMVAAFRDGRHIGVLSKESDKRRFNVAASRARDQMWLFHSVTIEDLSAQCLRRRLLEHCLNPSVHQEHVEGIEISQLRRQAYEANRATTHAPNPFDSWFEVDVFLRIVERGFRVIPQFALAGKRIDLLVEGMQGRLAVECDGDQWHGIAEWDSDIDRQRMLVRCGLEFWRVRGSAFYRDPSAALVPLWTLLQERGIHPQGLTPQPADRVPLKSEGQAVAVIDDSTEEEACTRVGSFEEPTTDSSDDEDEDNLTDATPISVEQEDTSGFNLSEYTIWIAHPVPDPHSASLQELMEGLIEIVAAEGPVVCRRVYQLYNRASGNARLGSQILHMMNRAIYRAVRLGRLQQNDEKKKGGQINQVVRIPSTPEVVVREKGPRALEEIPQLEVRALRGLLENEHPECDESILMRKLASAYEIRRVTTQIRKQLLS